DAGQVLHDDLAVLYQLGLELFHALQSDALGGHAAFSEDGQQAFCGSGGTVGLFPARLAIKARNALQFAPRSQLSLFHTLRGDTALWKKSAAETCTAHIERGQMYGLVPPPKNDFGRSASNVNHKPARRRRGQFVRYPGIDQTGFLGSGNAYYGATMCGFAQGAK